MHTIALCKITKLHRYRIQKTEKTGREQNSHPVLISANTPKGIRIPVASVKGRCPRPLDDGGTPRSALFSAFDIY